MTIISETDVDNYVFFFRKVMLTLTKLTLSN